MTEQELIDDQDSSNEALDVIKKLENSFVAEVKNGPIKKTGFSASALFYGPGNCARRWDLVFSGEVKESEDIWEHFNLRSVASGSSAHDELQSMIKNFNSDVIVEDEFWLDSPKMHGFIDLYFPEENIPVEIKTAGSRVFEYREGSYKPPIYQEMQLLIYMYIKRAKYGIIMYESRDDFRKIMIPITLTQERKEKVLKTFEWMKNIEATRLNGDKIKVFKGKRSNSKICGQCPIRKHCEGAPEGTVELPLLSKFAGLE